jgi:lipoyl(octanoyl) transferase
MTRSGLDHFPLREFGLSNSDCELLNNNTIVITKWNWEYGSSHAFQRSALELVQNTPGLRILICTSHPEVLTHGRGLQRAKPGETYHLTPFSRDDHPNLPYPFFQIERGGGLTFHHPGQFIFYPIVKLNPGVLGLSKMMDNILDFTISVLESWGIHDLHHKNKLLGLWHGDSEKIASMGIGIEKLTTFHGMALNLKKNDHMKSSLKNLNPCGLQVDTYVSVEELIALPENVHEDFRGQFLKRIKDEWK